MERLLQVLGDREWHRTDELVRRVGHSFAVAKFTLVRGWRPRGFKHTPRISYTVAVERDLSHRGQFRYRIVGAHR